MPDIPLKCPSSSTNGFFNHVAFFIALGVYFLFLIHKPEWLVDKHLFFVLIYFGVIAIYDLFDKKVFLNPSAGFASSIQNKFSFKRIFRKLLGLTMCVSLISLLYWVLPEYTYGLYKTFFNYVHLYFYPVMGITILYMIVADLFMKDPEDAYYHLGSVLFTKNTDKRKIGELLKSYIVRGYFLPIMIDYFAGDMIFFVNFKFLEPHNFKQWFDYIMNLIIIADLVAVVTGYSIAAKVLDNHIRSTDPYVSGWFVCRICYPPLWGALFYSAYFDYMKSPDWSYWFDSFTVWKYIWAGMLILFMGIYASASLAFGTKWSNLTYRGLVSSGVYKITKHPAYFFKNLAWWLTGMPFMVAPGKTWHESVQFSLLLAGVNLIYFLRARTEERHLSKYEDYRAYAMWMEKHGWLRFFGKIFPILKYNPEKEIGRL